VLPDRLQPIAGSSITVADALPIRPIDSVAPVTVGSAVPSISAASWNSTRLRRLRRIGELHPEAGQRNIDRRRRMPSLIREHHCQHDGEQDRAHWELLRVLLDGSRHHSASQRRDQGSGPGRGVSLARPYATSKAVGNRKLDIRPGG
jgi:hypothetical protein